MRASSCAASIAVAGVGRSVGPVAAVAGVVIGRSARIREPIVRARCRWLRVFDRLAQMTVRGDVDASAAGRALVGIAVGLIQMVELGISVDSQALRREVETLILPPN